MYDAHSWSVCKALTDRKETIASNLSSLFSALQLEDVESWEDEVEQVLGRFEKRHKRRPIYDICFF